MVDGRRFQAAGLDAEDPLTHGFVVDENYLVLGNAHRGDGAGWRRNDRGAADKPGEGAIGVVDVVVELLLVGTIDYSDRVSVERNALACRDRGWLLEQRLR